MANIILDKIVKWNNSLPIVQESVSALRNFVRVKEIARLIRTDGIDVLIEVARDQRYERIKPLVGQTLKAMSLVAEFEARIRARNATDLLALAGP